MYETANARPQAETVGNVVRGKEVDVLVNLKTRRRELALSQKRLATLMQIEQPTLSRWESRKQRPSLSAAIRLAHILDTSVDDLTGRATHFDNQAHGGLPICEAMRMLNALPKEERAQVKKWHVLLNRA